ncbi:MAG: helix-turn-helix transcriptional regulator [Phycisphaerales bacterium]|nr:MAG: helix-turn-helix transcriptional regulator [Phycisphaerales bacterium]
MNVIGQLERRMKETRTTQAALSRRTGIAVANISNLLRRKCDPQLRTLTRVCRELGCELVLRPLETKVNKARF